MKNLFLKILIICIMLFCVACGDDSIIDNTQIGNSQLEEVDAENLDYWIDRAETPDQVLMSVEEIEAQNLKMLSMWGIDWKSGYYHIVNFPQKVEREWLCDRICYLDLRNSKLYCKGELISASQWDIYYENLNLELIPEQVNISYGLVVNNTPAFDLPTKDIFTGSSLDESENSLQQTYLKMNEPVVVLWESADREWYYVVSNEYIGWIEAKDCALFANRDEWLDYQAQTDFLVVTKDCNYTGFSSSLLMSTKLYLAKDTDDLSIDGDYIVCIPEKGKDGLVAYSYVGLAKEAHLHEGYLPFTSRNVLTLAFQELGAPYGWGGIDGKRDCSLYVRDIYNCFGFCMPRNSKIQMSVPDMSVNTSEMTVQEKEELLDEIYPGGVMGISGHVMIYLGEVNRQHYVISMLGSYIPETVHEDFGNHIVSANKVMVNTLDVKRKNGNTWLQEILYLYNE